MQNEPFDKDYILKCCEGTSNSSTARKAFIKNMLFSKKDVIASFCSYISYFCDKTEHTITEESFQRKQNLCSRFLHALEQNDFPTVKSWWFYQYYYTGYGFELRLQLAYDVRAKKESEVPSFRFDDGYKLISVNDDFVSINEFASIHHVKEKTVHQWIKKGKLYYAKLNDDKWLIPAALDRPGRDKVFVQYVIDKKKPFFLPDYPELVNADCITIIQRHNDSDIFDCYVDTDDANIRLVLTKEKAEALQYKLLISDQAEVLDTLQIIPDKPLAENEKKNTRRGLRRFALNSDPEKEKAIKSQIRELKRQVVELQNCVMGTRWQPENDKSPSLAYGSILRALISLESILYLASSGYTGAINGLIRQLYEFNVWSKIGLMDDSDFVDRATKEFYSSGDIRSSRYLSKINYSLRGITSDEANLIVKETGKSIMDAYSLLTHGTGIAQQCPFPTDDFYNLWTLCLNEVVIHYKCLLSIIQAYLRKEERTACSSAESTWPKDTASEKPILTDADIFSTQICLWLSKIWQYEKTVEEWYPSSSNEKLLQEIFLSDWTTKK